MPDRPDPEFPAPFVSSVMRSSPNGSTSTTISNGLLRRKLFDRPWTNCTNCSVSAPNYLKAHNHWTMIAGMQRALSARGERKSDPLRVRCQLLAYDFKRIHLFEELVHAERRSWVSATCETMTLHVNMATKKGRRRGMRMSWPP